MSQSFIFSSTKWGSNLYQLGRFAIKTHCTCTLCCFSCVQLFATPWSPGSSVYGIFLARIPEWVAMPSSRIFLTHGSNLSLMRLWHCRQILYRWAIGEALVDIPVIPSSMPNSVIVRGYYYYYLFLRLKLVFLFLSRNLKEQSSAFPELGTVLGKKLRSYWGGSLSLVGWSINSQYPKTSSFCSYFRRFFWLTANAY